MNKVVLIGRLARDPDSSTIGAGTARCRFTVAVDRPFFKGEGEKQADFISVVAWRQQAEFVSKYFRKGSPIAIEGSIRTGSYEAQDGSKRYTTDVYAERIEFVPRNADGGDVTMPSAQRKTQISDLEEIKDDDTDLPF